MKKTLAILLLAGATFLTGCGDSFQDDFVFNNNNGIVVAPVCVDDAYTVNSNTTLTVNAANGVLANDTPNGASLTFDVLSANNGTIVGAADGGFSYTPAANFSGQDTFSYTLANNGGQRTCTVTITVNAVDGFFVDAANGNDGTGSFTNGLPFATIQAALAQAPAGSDIVVRAGNYTGTVTLENGDRLLGEGSVLAQGAAVRPVLTGPVVLGDSNTLDFLRIAGTNGDAVNGNNQNGGTITNCEIADTQDGSLGAGIELQDVRGSWEVSNNTISGIDGLAMDFESEGTDIVSVMISNNQVSGGDLNAISFLSEGSSQFTAFVINNTFSGNNLVAGNALELVCQGTATFCLDLEDNTNDDAYLFSNSDSGSVLNIEQLSTLTDLQPTGAGNTGGISIDTGIGFSAPTDRSDGFCSQP